MNNFDFNINNYSTQELESILELNFPYSNEDVKMRREKLYNSVCKNDLTPTMKNNFNIFLNNVQDKLSKTNNTFKEQKNVLINNNDNYIIEKSENLKDAYSKSRNDVGITQFMKAPPGIINPIKFKTINRTLNVDTRFRSNYDSTNSTEINLTLPYTFKEVISMCVSSFQMPLTFFAVNEKLENNTFTIYYDYSTVTGEYGSSDVITIPYGNYITPNSNIFGTLITDTVNEQLSDASFVLSYSIDHKTNKSSFTQDLSVNSVVQQYKIVFNDSEDNKKTTAMQTFGWMLGFRENTYESISGESIESEGVCYINYPNYIYLCIDDYNNNVNNYFISAFEDSINNKNIISRYNVSYLKNIDGLFQTAAEEGSSTSFNRKREYFGPVNIQRLKISLLDEFGNVIDLNNMDWSCTLMFECIYG